MSRTISKDIKIISEQTKWVLHLQLHFSATLERQNNTTKTASSTDL